MTTERNFRKAHHMMRDRVIWDCVIWHPLLLHGRMCQGHFKPTYWSINVVKWNFMQITEIWKRTLFKVGWLSWPRECMILNILEVCFNEIFGEFLYDVKMEWMCSKPILGHFPDWTYPRPTLPWLTHPRLDNYPTNTSPTWHFLDQTFPRAAISPTGHFWNWTFPRPDISPSGYLPDYTFPLPDFLNWLKLINS